MPRCRRSDSAGLDWLCRLLEWAPCTGVVPPTMPPVALLIRVNHDSQAFQRIMAGWLNKDTAPLPVGSSRSLLSSP